MPSPSSSLTPNNYNTIQLHNDKSNGADVISTLNGKRSIVFGLSSGKLFDGRSGAVLGKMGSVCLNQTEGDKYERYVKLIHSRSNRSFVTWILGLLPLAVSS